MIIVIVNVCPKGMKANTLVRIFFIFFKLKFCLILFYLYILASDPLSNIFRESVNESRSSSLFQHWKHFQAVNL
jgi:hypothetical protein